MVNGKSSLTALAVLAGLGYCATTNYCDISKNICINDGFVTLPIRGGIANITINTLEVNVQTNKTTSLRFSNGIPIDKNSATKPQFNNNETSVSWNIPSRNCAVVASMTNGRLRIQLSQPDNSNITWPITGGNVDAKYQSLQYPRGPGRNIPLRDEFWNQGTQQWAKGPGTFGDMVLDDEGVDVSNDFMMPFWGYSAGQGLGSAYMLEEDIETTVKHTSESGSLQSSFTHTFSQRENTLTYSVMFEVTDGSVLAPGFAYRRYLQETKNLLLMKDKITSLPQNKRLLGAFHAYCWGESGCDMEAMKKLVAFGIKKLWVGWNDNPMTNETTKFAKNQGYLVGPYDTFANGQPANESDTVLGIWPGTAYPDQCIRKADGSIMAGFHDRGCYMSTQAQALSELKTGNMAQRVRNSTATGANSYFLDVDASPEFFTDYSKDHPQNMMMDRKNRLDRMLKIAKEFVLGSENSKGWANSAVSFGHGSLTMVDPRFWTFLMNKKNVYGGYTPPGGPEMFFKPVDFPENFATTMFGPKYMIPLTEAVLHDSVVNVDRWDIPLYKFPVVTKQRVLQSMLYNVPVMLAINGTVIEEKGAEIAKFQKFFEPLHETGGLLPLTTFEYLSEDRMTQATTFGNGELKIIVNFGSVAKYGGPDKGCVRAILNNKQSDLCV
ncbi:hypothetical protein TWF694_006037 [Orbilia ellipsospora]|uniref:Uncharacterized protein n=1 Tax=Orbilia ellipsospora TaxID=2528407 RepID=A0AAV9WS44_9PEZI